MNVVSSQNTKPALAQRKPRRRRGIVPKGGGARVGALERRRHLELKWDGRYKSGRAGDYVYYVRKGKQRWRRHVVPRDPRTPTQLRSRAALGRASKAWSNNHLLTLEQRRAWREDGAKRRSRPRLTTSGKLTAQMNFVGRNSRKEQWGRELMLHPQAQATRSKERKKERVELIAEVQQRQRVVRSPSERFRTSTGPLPGQYQGRKPRARGRGKIGSVARLPKARPVRLRLRGRAALRTRGRPKRFRR